MNTSGISRRQAIVAGAICGVLGLVAWGFYLWVFRRDPGQDWMVFYTASSAYYGGNLPLVFDGEALTAALNQRFAGWLGFTLNLHPWVYPPTFLLLFLPFGALPPTVSLAVFLAVGFIAVLAAGFACAGRGLPRGIVAFSLMLCPAVPFNVMTGQNAFYTTALLAGGFGLLGRYPVAAGALLGLVSYKPQFWLMVPVALFAGRHWRALAAALASAFVLALVSFFVLGQDIWLVWVKLVTGIDASYADWLINGRLNGLSVFACATWAGAPRFLASTAQAVATVTAAGLVFYVFRRPYPSVLQLSVVLTATMLAAPHASASDAVLLALASSLFVAMPRTIPLPSARLLLAATVWVCPLLNPPSVFRPGILTPLLLLLFIGSVIAEMRERAGVVAAAA